MIGANGLSFDKWGMPMIPTWGGYDEPNSLKNFTLTGWKAHRRRYQTVEYDDNFSCFDEERWTTVGIGASGGQDHEVVGAYFAYAGVGGLSFPKTCRREGFGTGSGKAKGYAPPKYGHYGFAPPKYTEENWAGHYGVIRKDHDAIGEYGFHWRTSESVLSVPCAWRTSDPFVGPMTVKVEINNPVMVLDDDPSTNKYELNERHCDDTMVYLTSKPFMDFDDYDYGFYVYVKFGCDNGRTILASPTGDNVEWDGQWSFDAKDPGRFESLEYDYDDSCNFTYSDVRDIVIDIQQCSVVITDTKGLCEERLLSVPYDKTPLYVYLGADMNEPGYSTGVLEIKHFSVMKTQDQPGFEDAQGNNCEYWVDQDCESIDVQEQKDDLLANCPVACAQWQCRAPTVSPTPQPTPDQPVVQESCSGTMTTINMGLNTGGSSKTVDIPYEGDITSCAATTVSSSGS